MRLVKVAKLLKWAMMRRKKTNGKILDADDDIDMKMSVVGRKMTESITKKGMQHNIYS